MCIAYKKDITYQTCVIPVVEHRLDCENSSGRESMHGSSDVCLNHSERTKECTQQVIFLD